MDLANVVANCKKREGERLFLPSKMDTVKVKVQTAVSSS